MTVALTDLAKQDSADIYAYCAERNPNSAGRVVGAILKAANGLAHFPLLGKLGTAPGTRERVLTLFPYRIIYRIAGDRLEVLRVLHGARQWP